MRDSHHVALVDGLKSLPAETEWLEFKRGRCSPAQLGEYLSALANSACLARQRLGYLVFGIDDETHRVVERISTRTVPRQRVTKACYLGLRQDCIRMSGLTSMS